MLLQSPVCWGELLVVWLALEAIKLLAAFIISQKEFLAVLREVYAFKREVASQLKEIASILKSGRGC